MDVWHDLEVHESIKAQAASVSPIKLIAGGGAVAAVAAGGASHAAATRHDCVGGAGCPHCGCRCGKGQGKNNLFHFVAFFLKVKGAGLMNFAFPCGPTG